MTSALSSTLDLLFLRLLGRDPNPARGASHLWARFEVAAVGAGAHDHVATLRSDPQRAVGPSDDRERVAVRDRRFIFRRLASTVTRPMLREPSHQSAPSGPTPIALG